MLGADGALDDQRLTSHQEQPICRRLPPRLRAWIVLVDRSGELTKVRAESAKEPQDGAQPDVALSGLKARQVGAARAHSLCDLLLREPSLLAQFPESLADGLLIWTCHTG